MPATESNDNPSSRSGTPAFRRHQGRRDFLKTTAMLGAAAATLEFWAGGPACAAASPNGKLNVAAIGVGDRGSEIGHAAGQMGNMVAILLLEPHSDHELRLKLIDPDGGGHEALLKARTLAEPVAPRGNRVQDVPH
jgi:hypothetical protein